MAAGVRTAVSCLLVGPQNEALDQTDFQTNRASGKAKSQIQSVLVQRTMGGHQSAASQAALIASMTPNGNGLTTALFRARRRCRPMGSAMIGDNRPNTHATSSELCVRPP